jgi:hypothetical protein
MPQQVDGKLRGARPSRAMLAYGKKNKKSSRKKVRF